MTGPHAHPPGASLDRRALDSATLTAYFDALTTLPVGPTWAVLQLLPRTGLRIGELCGLRRADVDLPSRTIRAPRGKVFVTDDARVVLQTYLDSTKSADVMHPDDRAAMRTWLFPGYYGPIGPAAVRKVLRQLRETQPGLAPVTVRALRACRRVGRT